jgi:hypothetical protein
MAVSEWAGCTLKPVASGCQRLPDYVSRVVGGVKYLSQDGNLGSSVSKGVGRKV